jgi:hypothetical protein
MKNRDEVFGALVISILFVLVAWGNAVGMMVVSAIGLQVELLALPTQLTMAAEGEMAIAHPFSSTCY